MARDKMMQKLGQRNPNALREKVQAVDILSGISEQEEATQKPIEQEAQPSGVQKEIEKEAQKNRPEKVHKEKTQKRGTRKKGLYSDASVRTVLAEKKRKTKRYSFEIYEDQEADLARLCALYREATGEYLSASRVIREVLDTFLPDALRAFEKEED